MGRGVKVCGRLMKEFRFVDDYAMPAGSQNELNKMLPEYDMKINIKQTEIVYG